MKPFLLSITSLLLLASTAQAAKIIAVLPFDVSHAKGKVDAAAQASLEELLRDATSKALGKAGWTVLSGQNTLQLLKDNDVDPTKCGDGSCQLTTAREIKTTMFVSGSIQVVEGILTASLRLIDTNTGAISASESLDAENVRELRKKLAQVAPRLFEGAASGGTTPKGQTCAGESSDLNNKASALAEKNDWKAAVPLFRKACEAGCGASCTSLGWAYETGDGVPEDGAMGARYNLKGCQAGNAPGCENLAYQLAKGLGVAEDRQASWQYYDLACRLESETSCQSVSVLTTPIGQNGLATDDAKLRKLACINGLKRDCEAPAVDEGVKDHSTGLVWQKRPAKQLMTWRQATAWCEDLGGDWRLPEAKELRDLAYHHIIKTGPTDPETYWAAEITIRSDQPGPRRATGNIGGDTGTAEPTALLGVRCVSGESGNGPSGDTDD